MLTEVDKEMSFELLFERHPSPMWVFDSETFEFLAVNEAAIKKHGFSRRELLAMTVDQLAHPQDIHILYRARAQRAALQTEEPQAFVWRTISKIGTAVDVETAWSDVPFEGRSAVLAVIRDMTASQQAEKRARDQADLLDLASDPIMVFD